jgi:protein SCO1/2
MTAIRALRIIRWTTVGVIGLILAGALVLLELGAKSEFRGAAADNAAVTVAVAGAPIGGPFSLVDHKGRAVTDAAYRGRWMLVFFGYSSCPDDCPLTLQKMASALNSLGPLADRIAPLFITVDPARDTPERLSAYLANFGSRIIGLTGNSAQIAAVAKAYRVYYAAAEHEQSGIDLVGHSTFLYLMNPAGKLDAVLRPDASAEQLAATLRERLSTEKATGASG